MEIKEIAEKVLNDENVDELTKDFDDNKKLELDKTVKSLAKEQAATELEKAKALRAERNRVEKQAFEANNDASEKFKKQIREEQVQKASKKFQSDMGLTEDQMKPIIDSFPTFDSGKFDADLIYPDLLASYAKVNAHELIESQKLLKQHERNAMEFNMGSAGGSSAGGGSEDNTKKYSPEVVAMVKEAQRRGISLTLEQAERGMKGGTRIFK